MEGGGRILKGEGLRGDRSKKYRRRGWVGERSAVLARLGVKSGLPSP